MSEILIDLDDAARREAQHPEGIPVRLGGQVFMFPAELPLDAFDPLLSPKLGLMEMIAQLTKEDEARKGRGEAPQTAVGDVIDMLLNRPTLPLDFLDAFRAVYCNLLGDEQYARWAKVRPSIPAYVRLTKSLLGLYSVSLGKLFTSADSSAAASATSKPTSSGTTDSTPEASTSAPDNPDSSAAAGS
jgi:hypothetical protein